MTFLKETNTRLYHLMLNLAYFQSGFRYCRLWTREQFATYYKYHYLYINIQTDLLLKTHSLTYVTKEKRKNRRRSVSTSASKPVNFEPDAKKIPDYYKNVCLEELKCR